MVTGMVTENQAASSPPVSPAWFIGSLLLFGMVIFSVPDSAVFPLSFVIVFGTLLAAHNDAAKRGVKSPLEELLG
jgi:hypothetical protein